MSKILSTSSSVMGARVFGAGLGFITQVLLARALSADELGIFFLAASIATISGTAAALGYPNLIPILSARYQERAKPQLLAAFAGYARRQVAYTAAVTMVCVAL